MRLYSSPNNYEIYYSNSKQIDRDLDDPVSDRCEYTLLIRCKHTTRELKTRTLSTTEFVRKERKIDLENTHKLLLMRMQDLPKLINNDGYPAQIARYRLSCGF